MINFVQADLPQIEYKWEIMKPRQPDKPGKLVKKLFGKPIVFDDRNCAYWYDIINKKPVYRFLYSFYIDEDNNEITCN